MRKKVLGRGLDALIPEVTKPENASNEIDIDRIVMNPKQPRLHLDEKRLQELVSSIRKNGILQPILVRPYKSGYQLIAGERRLTAAQRAGVLKVPAVIRDVPDDQLLELALVENIQRERLNPIEEAQAYEGLLSTTGDTQEIMAERLGKDRSTVANSLRLLKLPPNVKKLVGEGMISPGHARALLSSNSSPSEIGKIAQIIIDKGWSVRETERWAKRSSLPPPRPKIEDPNQTAAADKLRLLLGTKVEIRSKSKEKGEIRIHYFSQDELIRVYGILMDKAESMELDNGIRQENSEP